MSARRTLNVAPLPDYAFGHQGLIWWGTLGFMVIEGSMFVMVLVAYFFLRTRVPEWPPSAPDPDVTFGTVTLLLMLASIVPNQMAKKAAEELDLRRVRMVMPIVVVFAIALLVSRVFEFMRLGVPWDYNAYASIVWFILGLHTAHLLTDFADTVVLTALIFTAYAEPKRLVDVSENSLYWYFVVLSWIPIYLVLYFAPRWL
jgi:heme/copper-type cytochrome/quinol oxidase subunit 3